MKHLSSSSMAPSLSMVRKALAALVFPIASLATIAIHSSAQAQAITNPNSITRVSSFAYNAQGLLEQEVIEPDSAQSCLVTTHSYDGYGNKVSVSTTACAGASGHTLSSANTPRVASSAYSADGRFPVLTTNALGHSEAKLYDGRFGLVSSLTGPNSLTTTWLYDGFGRKTRESRADGTYSTWDYKYCSDAGASCPSSITAQGAGASNGASPILAQTPVWQVTERVFGANNLELGPYKRQYHDALNRVIRAETLGFDGAGLPAIVQVQDTAYNALGQVARKSNTYNAAQPASAVWIAYTYDVLGRLIKEEAPDPMAAGGIATTYISYNGLSSTITNSKGQGKTTVKDALGRTASVTDTQGNQVSYQYDALGQLIQTDAGGNITKIQYNLRGQKIRMDDPAMGVWEYAYNAFGELVYQSDSVGQSTTIAYDALGRMVQRNESDLISSWVYDNCAKGIGKLCQATSDNGYKRVHSYDSLGRPSSTATKLDTTVTTSISYETATGRVSSQTYPTGYQARYTYTALGFLQTVSGVGTGAGTGSASQTATYTVLAINAQGQITSYRYGNQVITNKTYDAQTGRLTAITATKEGLATGGIQQTTYQYDSLSNLTARGDVNTGVQETFLYDNLNRLTNYQAIGGSVTAQDASANVQVIYDARGNITYKSDVGRYWYDPQRPNRLTNITLESMPGAAPLTGTRALAYAFDDYNANARTLGVGMGAASGVVMGNGNLMYTVSQDNTTGRHSIRWESYTSFNMPKELALVNLGQAQTSTAAVQTGAICPAGSNPVGSDCVIPANTTIPAEPTYAACANGFVLQGNQCVKTSTVPYAYNSAGTCMAGDGNSFCNKRNVTQAACIAYSVTNGLAYVQYNSDPFNGLGNCSYSRTYRCPVGTTTYWDGWDTRCRQTTSQPAVQIGYSCPSWAVAVGSSCIAVNNSVSAATPTYACSGQYSLKSGTAICEKWTYADFVNLPNSCVGSDTEQAVNGIMRCVNTAQPSVQACINYIVSNNRLIPGLSSSVSANPCAYARSSRCIDGRTRADGRECERLDKTVTASITSYSCPAGTVLAGDKCLTSQTQTVALTPIYSCPAGSTLSGDRCYADNITSSQVANRTLTFTYGPEHQRISQRTQLDASAPSSMSAAPGVVYYLNGENNNLSYEKEVKDNGLIEHKHYLSAGGIVFAMQINREGNLATGGTGGTAKPASTLQYLHHDHLGSVAVVTDETGSVAERLAYDPWGKRRFTNGTADTADTIVGLTLDRGYTMHEHLDEMGVIHMNGRIYDPLIGRFMSADPFIQAPENLQSHNRFAYVMNNPLAYTDPSGYFSLKKLFRAVLAIAVGYFTGQWIGWHAMAVPGITSMQVGIISGMAGGFAGGLVASGGNIKGALQGALTGGLFGWAGEIGGVTSPSRYLAHATAGCISAVAGGGKCGQGAVSAMFGKYTTNWIGQNTSIQSDIAKGIATTVAGGVGSVIAGGKFENGATTAAYGYVFNWMMHVHASITADALKTQLPAGSASELAKAVALTDMNPSWSVSQDPANAVWHGMCTGGDSTSACDLKKTDYMDKQWQAKSPAGFARLAHAIQDYEAPMHAGKPYSGFATRTEAIAHGLSDLRPPPQEYDRLVNRTRQLFIDYNKHCNGCLR